MARWCLMGSNFVFDLMKERAKERFATKKIDRKSSNIETVDTPILSKLELQVGSGPPAQF